MKVRIKAEDEVESLDCAARQEQKGRAKATAAAAPPFLNTSIAIQLAVTQVWKEVQGVGG